MHLFGPTLDHDCEHRQPEDDSQPVIDDSPDRKDHGGKLIMGVAGATFAIYSEESGGSPLWMETQNITADAEGSYAVQLAATKPQGLPLDLFSSGERAGWERAAALAVAQRALCSESGRCANSGGLPASAFLLAAPVSGSSVAKASTASSVAAGVQPALAGSGTTITFPCRRRMAAP